MCSCVDRESVSNSARLVTGDEFIKVYNFDRNVLSHADYQGEKNGFHYLDVYHPGPGSKAEYQYTIKARSEDLPKSFPDQPQNKIKSLNEL